jgi:hypothetical protein
MKKISMVYGNRSIPWKSARRFSMIYKEISIPWKSAYFMGQYTDI